MLARDGFAAFDVQFRLHAQLPEKRHLLTKHPYTRGFIRLSLSLIELALER